MLSNKERIVWIFVVIIAIITTFFLVKPSRQMKVSFSTVPTVSTSIQSMSDIEREADVWFSTGHAPIPRRDWLQAWDHWDSFLSIYNESIQQNQTWTIYPEQIALRFFYSPPEVDGVIPDEISAYYANHNPNIVTVIITNVTSPAGVGARETRLDLVKVDKNWKIVWAGERSITLK